MDAPLGISTGAGRHLRRHRRRDGGGPAHRVGDRHRDAVPVPQPARRRPSRASKASRSRPSRSRAPRATGRSSRAPTSRSRWPHGLGNAQKVIDMVKSGEAEFHFVEVMTCPGGCIGGGGQPRFTTNEVRKKRLEAIYQEDEQPRAAQVPREPRRLHAVRGVPRGAVRRDLAPPPAHPLLRARPRLRRGARKTAAGRVRRRAREAAPGDRGRLRGPPAA